MADVTAAGRPGADRRRAGRQWVAALLGLVVVAAASLTLGDGRADAAARQRAFTFYDFTDTSGLVLNGGPGTVRTDGGADLRLTDGPAQIRSAWYDDAIEPTLSFHTTFVATFHSSPLPPGDGLAFVVQSSVDGSGAIGNDGGGSLGYGGITPSVEVEFDDYRNEGDPDDNHVAITTNGDATTALAVGTPDLSFYDTGSPLGGRPFKAWVDYDAHAHLMSVYVSPTTDKPATPTVSASVDLGAVLGARRPARAGFTASTGAASQTTDLSTWRFWGVDGETPDTHGYAYVAMGDSYSSGEGVPTDDYYPGTSFPYAPGDPEGTGGEAGCHRSKVGYPVAVADKLGLDASAWRFAACSGAEIPALTEENRRWAEYGEVEAPQISYVSPTSTSVVTMTIGGNDVGFQPILTDCTWDTFFVSGGRPGCRKNGRSARALADRGLVDLADGRLRRAFETVGMQIKPGGRLVVSGYPRLFGTTGHVKVRFNGVSTGACLVGRAKHAVPVFVSSKDAKWIDGVEDKGANIIEREAKVADEYLAPMGVDVVYAPADKAFHGHRLCDTGSAYLNGVVFYGTNSHPDRRSFHPNAKGQSKAYAKVFKAKV